MENRNLTPICFAYLREMVNLSEKSSLKLWEI
jgi:hypothetical protein